MMKTIKYLSMAALLVVGAIIMSCSTSDDMPGEDQPKSQTVTVTTTISLNSGAETRALDADGHKTFAAGDMIAVIYKNTSNVTVKATSTALDGANISSDKKTATFTVTLDNPQAGTVDYVYPAAMANDDGTMASIDSQDGTLATIQSKYDYARGSGTMTVSGTNATLPSNVSLVNQLAICKFTIKNSGGTDITSSINNLTISDGTNNYAVTPSSALSTIYVAMKPVDSKTITLNATAGGAGYVKTVTGQTLNASKFYPINVTMEAFSPTGNPFTIEAKTAGTIKIANPKSGMKYTKNGGDKTAVTSDAISVAAGDILQFYGNGITGYGGTTDGASTKIEGGTADFYAYGNIMSLLDEDGFATNTDFSTSTDTYTFAFLFYDNTHLYSHPAKALELPATTLLEGCYYYMFYGCTHLTKAPVLPAATLVKYCYANMFRGCSSLNYVKCIGNPINSKMNYTSEWLSGVSSSGTFVKKSGVTTWWTGSGGIPSGWTVTEE